MTFVTETKQLWRDAIRARMRAWEMTQTQMRDYLADEHDIHVSQATISNWIRGEKAPAERIRPALADALDIAAHEIAPAYLRVAATVPPRPKSAA